MTQFIFYFLSIKYFQHNKLINDHFFSSEKFCISKVWTRIKLKWFLCYVLSIIMNFQSMRMTVFSISCVCMINIDLNFLYCKLNFLVPYFITLNHQMSCSIQINLNICHYGTYFQEVFYCLQTLFCSTIHLSKDVGNSIQVANIFSLFYHIDLTWSLEHHL